MRGRREKLAKAEEEPDIDLPAHEPSLVIRSADKKKGRKVPVPSAGREEEEEGR